MDVKIEVKRRADEDHIVGDMVRFNPSDFTYPQSGGHPYSGQTIHLEGYYLDRHEVSNREYREFLAAQPEVGQPKYWEQGYPDGYDDYPVVGISWDEAASYATWCGKRLPTLAEWQRAAGGLEGRPFPYLSTDQNDIRGNVRGERLPPVLTRAQHWEGYLHSAMPVNAFPEAATPEGVFNLFGNVDEFTETIPVARLGHGFVPREWDRWVVGGAWDAVAAGSSITNMRFTGISRDDAMETRGFRCAKSVD
jgi:formylglycine-generating enzyme required for sulfatase activity